MTPRHPYTQPRLQIRHRHSRAFARRNEPWVFAYTLMRGPLSGFQPLPGRIELQRALRRVSPASLGLTLVILYRQFFRKMTTVNVVGKSQF